ncbi:MAG: carboxypeptidase regulatory-like domain-containing protein [Candidatus Eisenbacteria sp.]|nr:carboxypeptidase regulatory-like domain-containing protein [Candidatus Eisenbacteria bacterium]
MIGQRHGTILLALLLGLLVLPPLVGARPAGMSDPGDAGAAPVRSTDHLLHLQTPAPTGRIIVKFVDSSGLAVRDGRLAPYSGATQRLEGLLVRRGVGYHLERHFSRPPEALAAERALAESRTRRAMPNLDRYARIVPARPLAQSELLALLADLLADPAVALAFLEPRAVPAALGFDAFTDAACALRAPALVPDHPPTLGPIGLGHTAPLRAPRTPDFTGLQGYLDPAPTGVDAEGVWAQPGGRGQTVKVLDIEGAWLWEHEDLPAPFFTAGGAIDDISWRNHGTAVIGEIRGISNAYGVTGIAYETEVGGVSIAELSTADAINTAAANLDVGDIVLIELHAPGPNATGEGQFGYVCIEFWQDNFDAIQLATATGRIVCEAAGNGEQDLDSPVYQGLFDRNVRDSGAIICGASNGENLDPAWFTNYGSRVDLHGWGAAVTTCGYGSLQGGAETEWYTAGFGGTSSASPIVAGAVAALQGMSKAAFGIPINARLARDVLVATGTPQGPGGQIGPRPDLTAAWTLAQTGIGAVAGTITESGGAPLAEVQVTVVETGAIAQTDAAGQYFLPLLVDDYELTYESFFYATSSEFVSVTAGETTQVDLELSALPTVTIGGTVLAADGATNLAGARITPQNVPLPGATSDVEGDWSIPGFPVGRIYAFLVDSVSGHGADFATVAVADPRRVDYGLFPQLPAATADFEADGGGFTAEPIWSWGTPTAGGPAAGFSGQKCWGVGMDANYEDLVFGYLTSPSYDFSGAAELHLSFHYWVETEPNFDGATVEAWDAAGADWEAITPLNGYNSVALGGLGFENGWSGSSGGWEGTVFDLTGFISDEIAFRIAFGSDGYVNEAGFWIDDVAFDTGDAFSLVRGVPGPRPVISLTMAPNPFVGRVHIELTLAASSVASFAIIDPAGRYVRQLHSGRLPGGVTGFRWDGRDAAGRQVASGIYFLNVRAGEHVLCRPLILLR